MVNYRTGDVWSPHIEPGEALQAVVSHFAECIREGKPPLSDGNLGLRVVRMLEAANRSIRAQGGRVVLSSGAQPMVNGSATHERSGSGQLHPDRPGRPAGSKRRPCTLR